ncbi:MAG: ABC transporter ATP-binding protein [Deltaproteobacteria bacterium]|nr:ABC transporter ATP-binding protein [Deltaproteobacteria bacterium]
MILSVSGIAFAYKSHPVLDGVTFALGKGQILGILGVNGAGKSTLLKCLNGILRARRGTVFLNGEDIRHLRGDAIARGVGYVPQRYGDEPLSVYDAVLLGRRPHIRWAATRRDLAVVEEVLGLMRLEAFALRPVNELSGGEAQKVMIARALAQEPELLLLDEPLSNLDLGNQLEVMQLLEEAVRQRGLTAILSLHDVNTALRFADRFLLLKEGRVHAFATRETLSAAIIEEVYGVRVLLQEIQGYPVMVPWPRSHKRHPLLKEHIDAL